MRNKNRLKIYLLVDAYWYMAEALKLRRASYDAIQLVAFYKGAWDLPNAFTPGVYVRWGCTILLHDMPERLTLNQPDGLFKAKNKPVARLIWKEHGLPIPETWIRDQDVKYPCIVRQHRHAQGQNFYIANNKAEIETIPFDSPYYYQEIWPNEKEYRVHVCGDKTHGISYKPSIETDIRRNASITGEELIVTSDYPKQIETLAIEAMRALNLDFGAVDIMTNGDKCAILEVNASPGLGTDKRKIQGYVDYFKSKMI